MIETAWLPDDSTEQMRKPCEITLDDLPKSFDRDTNLAEKLGMRRDEVAEFAERNGLPVEILNDLIQTNWNTRNLRRGRLKKGLPTICRLNYEEYN